METSVGGMLVMGVLLATIILISRAIVVSNTMMGTAITDAADVAGERTRTNLEFQSAVSAISTGSTDLTVTVKNVGSTSVSDYDRMDLIVAYESPGGLGPTREVRRLKYTSGVLSSNQWKDASRFPDFVQPRIWDPGETLTMAARIAPEQISGTTGTVHVSTPNGVVAFGSFTTP